MPRPLLLILLALAGCQAAPDAPPPPATATAAPTAPAALTNRVWMRADQPDLPGAARIFLADGTLVMDSCWETYRLERWTAEADTAVRWQESGHDVRAAIVMLSADSLVLRVAGERQPYRAAPVPFLCPDLPR